jgi:hypothetical protein
MFWFCFQMSYALLLMTRPRDAIVCNVNMNQLDLQDVWRLTSDASSVLPKVCNPGGKSHVRAEEVQWDSTEAVQQG